MGGESGTIQTPLNSSQIHKTRCISNWGSVKWKGAKALKWQKGDTYKNTSLFTNQKATNLYNSQIIWIYLLDCASKSSSNSKLENIRFFSNHETNT